jgi:hypothetical protein
MTPEAVFRLFTKSSILTSTQKVRSTVILANAGIQNHLIALDPGVRRDDAQHLFSTFYDFINFKSGIQGLIARAGTELRPCRSFAMGRRTGDGNQANCFLIIRQGGEG